MTTKPIAVANEWFAEGGDTAPVLTRNPVRDNAQAFTATGGRSTHAWYRNHAIEIHSGSSGSRCWARVVLILYETPHTWSALEAWPTDDQWDHTPADAVAAAINRVKAWIDGRVDRAEDVRPRPRVDREVALRSPSSVVEE